MLLPVFASVNGPAPSFGDYEQNYLNGVTNLPWVPITPSKVSGYFITWSVSPALPSGLILNTSTGTITGTPTVGGVFICTVTAQNNAGSVSKQITFNISTDTYIEWDSPGEYSWTMLNGMCNNYFRSIVCSGGGGGAEPTFWPNSDINGLGGYVDEGTEIMPESGGGGGSGRHFANQIGQFYPGDEVTIIIGSGGGPSSGNNRTAEDGEASILYLPNVSEIYVQGGFGAQGTTGGLAGGGNNGKPGSNGFQEENFGYGAGCEECGSFVTLLSGINLIGGHGGEGFVDYGVENGLAGGYLSTGGGAYFNQYGSVQTIFNPMLMSPGNGGGGGGYHTKSIGSNGLGYPDGYMVLDEYVASGSSGAWGYVKLDWGQPDIYWANFNL